MRITYYQHTFKSGRTLRISSTDPHTVTDPYLRDLAYLGELIDVEIINPDGSVAEGDYASKAHYEHSLLFFKMPSAEWFELDPLHEEIYARLGEHVPSYKAYDR